MFLSIEDLGIIDFALKLMHGSPFCAADKILRACNPIFEAALDIINVNVEDIYFFKIDLLQ